jgi:hypothetical protein
MFGGTVRRSMFISWNDNTDWDISRYSFSTSSTVWEDNFLTGAGVVSPNISLQGKTAGKGMPHPMIVGADDLLYIGSGNQVHAIDGSVPGNGKFIENILTIPSGYIIQGFSLGENHLVIFASYANFSATEVKPSHLNKCKVFFWNYLDLDPDRVIDLDDNKVCAVFQYGATFGCVTTGMYNAGNSQSKPHKIQLWNGSSFEMLANFDGEEPINGGVQVINKAILVNVGSRIYQWGCEFPTLPSSELFQPYNSGGGNASGLLKRIAQDIILCSSGTGANGGLIYQQDAKYSSGRILLPFVRLETPFRMRAQVKAVKVNFHQVITSSAARPIIRLITENTAINTTVIGTSDNITTATEDTMSVIREKDVNGNPLPPFNSLAPYIEWDMTNANLLECLGVESISVEFEYIKHVIY